MRYKQGLFLSFFVSEPIPEDKEPAAATASVSLLAILSRSPNTSQHLPNTKERGALVQP